MSTEAYQPDPENTFGYLISFGHIHFHEMLPCMNDITISVSIYFPSDSVYCISSGKKQHINFSNVLGIAYFQRQNCNSFLKDGYNVLFNKTDFRDIEIGVFYSVRPMPGNIHCAYSLWARFNGQTVLNG